MALVLGVNCGFVTTAPTADPSGTSELLDNYSLAGKILSPSSRILVSSLGTWIDNATEAGDIELGIYTGSGTDPDVLLGSVTIAKGLTAGWKTGTLANPIVLAPNTYYWIAVQIDDTATLTNTNSAATGGITNKWKSPATALINPWGASGGTIADKLYAVYAVYGPYSSANTKSTRFLKTNWPITSGLIAETTSQTGHVSNLIPENSLVLQRDMVGL